MISMPSYPRRQRYRRLARALAHGGLALVMLLLAALATLGGLSRGAVVFGALGVGFAMRSRRWARLARRSAIGARSEQLVRARLRALEQEGWSVRHSLAWRGGDIDHLAIGPSSTRVAFAIETKTRSYWAHDLKRITEAAAWHGGRGMESYPVLCLAGLVGVERWEEGVAVLSLERLVPLLRRLAGTTPRPAFLRSAQR